MDRIIAASPILAPGKGYNSYRVVLKANYNKHGEIQGFVVTRQYLLIANPDTLSWGNGEYFNVYKAELKAILQEAFTRFQTVSAEAVKEWPLAAFADYQRFMIAISIAEEKYRQQEEKYITYGLPQEGDILCDGSVKGSL